MEVVLFAQKFELVDESFSVESCLFPSFDVELNRRIQLLAGDQSTERLSAIAADVKSLKRFIAALYSADAVAFLAALESFRSTNLLVGNGVPSSLILLNDRWEILHKIAQSRAQTATTHNEAPPKFKLLYDVLMNDIPQSLSKTDSQQPNSAFKTLVIVRNDAAKRTVNRFLRDGSLKDVMAHEKQDLDRFAASIPTSFRTNAFVGSRQTAQQALLKRLKLTATGASAAASISHAKEASILTPVTQTTQTSPADELSAFCNDDDSTFCIDAQDFDETFAVLKDSCILVKTFDEVQDDFFALHKPNFVVLFDYNLAIIRMLELFNSMHAGCVSRLYFLLYKGSIEEQRYLAEIRREKTAFERLIEQKSSMPHVNRPLHNDEQDSLAAAAIEAIEECGGQQAAVAAAAKQKIVVDVRELRSPLAFLLHKAGFGVVPATLPIGDYVLSRNVCIERKAIADLVASFNSGRLYTQVQAMCSAYRRAVLLVEFDAKKQSFNLQGSTAVFTVSDIAAKLVLLAIHFPTLRIVWSPSLQFTATTFASLKRDAWNGAFEEEPDVSAALAETFDESYDAFLRELLLKIDGISDVNVGKLLGSAATLRDVALRAAAGGEKWRCESAVDCSRVLQFLRRNILPSSKM